MGENRDDERYWGRDPQGRPFRKPFAPTYEDLKVIKDLDQQIDDFVWRNEVSDKVRRIMKNMVPEDVETLLSQGDLDSDQCANPTAVTISRIRRIETSAGRPNALKRYSRRHNAQDRSRS